MTTSRTDLILRQLDALRPPPRHRLRALLPARGQKVNPRALSAVVAALWPADAAPRQRAGRDLAAELWMHSLAVGCAAELLAERAVPGSTSVVPQVAFVCGLLHDLGKLALHAIVPRAYARVTVAADAMRGNIRDIEQTLLGLDHHDAGGRIAEGWSLPAIVRDVVWFHDQPAPALPEAVAPHADMIGLIGLADCLMRRHRLGYSGNYSLAAPPHDVSRRLGLELANEPALDELLARIAERELLARIAERRSMIVPADSAAGEKAHHTNGRRSAPAGASPILAGGSRSPRTAARLAKAFTRARSVADTLDVIAQSAAGVLGCESVASFVITSESAAEMALVQTGEPAAHGRADDSSEPAYLRPVRPATGKAGSEIIRIAGDDLEWLTSVYGPRLPGQARWWLPLDSQGQALGGIAWGGGEREPERLESQLGELASLRLTWSLALRAAVAQQEAAQLVEQLAALNRRLADGHDPINRERAGHSLAELAAGAAHEMNNPLMVISGRSQLLSQRLSDPQDRQAALAIHQNAQRLSDMITALMRFARPEPADRRPVGLDALRSRTMQLVAAMPERAGRHVEWNVPELPPLHVDAEQIARAMSALLENALQATADGAWIQVQAALDATQQGVVISIIDRGIGMDPQTLRRAFDPFFSQKPAGRRRGMGLPNALRLVEANGGTLCLDSRHGAGTRAILTLPIAMLPSEASGHRKTA